MLAAMPIADRRHIAFDVFHGVINSKACGYGTAGAVDIKVDILGRILRLQKQKLSHNNACGSIIYLFAQEYDTLL